MPSPEDPPEDDATAELRPAPRKATPEPAEPARAAAAAKPHAAREERPAPERRPPAGNAAADRELSAWRAEIDRRIRLIWHRLDHAEEHPQGGVTDAGTLIETGRAALNGARTTVDRKRSLWHQLLGWWSGGPVTSCWQAVHEAENVLLGVESTARAKSAIPHIRQRLEDSTPATSPERKRYSKRLDELWTSFGPADRDELRAIGAFVDGASDERHADLRKLRNQLTGLSIFFGFALVAVGVLQVIFPHFLSLCGSPTPGLGTHCLDGSSQPSRGDLFQVEIVGALGGLLGALLPLSKMKTAPSRYNVRTPQAVVKIVAGAMAGWLGVVLVQSGLLIAPVAVSASALLAYAGVFGLSQQLLTRYLDKQAARVIGEPSEQPAAQ